MVPLFRESKYCGEPFEIGLSGVDGLELCMHECVT